MLDPPPYPGGRDDLDVFEAVFKTFAPGWMERDMRIMFDRFQKDGMSSPLGGPPRSCRDFAVDMAKS